MRNYYATLNAKRDTSVFDLTRKLQDLENVEPELAGKAIRVLLTTDQKTVYDKVHLQFQAIALAYKEFSGTDFEDTNDWDRRLVEFLPPEYEESLMFNTIDSS